MGSGRFDASAYATFTDSIRGASTDKVYASRAINSNLNPLNVKLRESRDSADNPKSTPVIVALDVTGSMGMIADVIARQGLGTLFTSLLDKAPISDPHLMFMGIGDATCDNAPLQVSQFEADARIIEQLTQLFLEHGGGGNNYESYHLPWYFAAFHTEHDSYIKRGKRGYLFTIGDEQTPAPLTKEQITRFIGDTPQQDYSAAELLRLAQRTYNVFHIAINEGNYAKQYPVNVRKSWTNLMGQNVIFLNDHTKLAETIVSAIEIAEGRDAEASTSSWGASARVVLDAVKMIPRGRPTAMLSGPG